VVCGGRWQWQWQWQLGQKEVGSEVVWWLVVVLESIFEGTDM
jgi:hypothetical protein